ncbi:fibrous sheath-interacting protein 1 [Gracilinanus agilis]|uniref:fibrous sheath-interacting protein 1 n=1 Tax=Gracilinanus agilis TaxID=191870 RepID=UPI001CFD8E7B|nr:fibrous sheath-interacting protein 1 [Gracilinanus agilis]
MDIIRGNLDKISRPASNSRIHHESKISSTSLEVLTPEPVTLKVDTSINLNSSSQQSNRENCNSRESSSNSNGGKKNSSQDEKNSQDYCSEVDCSLREQTKSSCTNYSDHNASLNSSREDNEVDYFNLYDMPQEMSGQVKEGVSRIKESDLQLQEAVEKMKRLDKVLVEKQFKEREIKKQGQEMRIKMWEELQTNPNFDAIQNNEEIENTKKFLSLASSSEGTTDFRHLEQEEPCVSVFHTQIPPEEYENCVEQARRESVYHSESNKSLIKAEKKLQRENSGEFKTKKNQDFIKRNIELAKDSKNMVIMMDKEKQRLNELLSDIDKGKDLSPRTESYESAWPLLERSYLSTAHMERKQLAQIDSKLQDRFSFTSSWISNGYLGMDNHIGQETDPNDKKRAKMNPGDKILRNNRDYRYEKNRLKEIDQQLKELEKDIMKTRVLSEEHLKTLLEKCILEQSSDKDSRDGNEIRPESIQPSSSFFLRLRSESPAVSRTEGENEDVLEIRECESPGYYLTKALDGREHIPEFWIIETEEDESPRPSGDIITSDGEGYFMSKALGVGRLKRPSFLDDPLYCISVDSGPSREDECLKLIDCSTESLPGTGDDDTKTKAKVILVFKEFTSYKEGKQIQGLQRPQPKSLKVN